MKLFQDLDANHDGQLTPSELQNAMEQLGLFVVFPFLFSFFLPVSRSMALFVLFLRWDDFGVFSSSSVFRSRLPSRFVLLSVIACLNWWFPRRFVVFSPRDQLKPMQKSWNPLIDSDNVVALFLSHKEFAPFLWRRLLCSRFLSFPSPIVFFPSVALLLPRPSCFIVTSWTNHSSFWSI